jgi:hypothetical protein
VGAIAKGLIGGVSAPAEANRRPSGEAKGFSFGIDNLKITFHPNGAVIVDRNFRRCHFFS